MTDLSLLQELLFLHYGVVQLCVSIADFLLHDKTLKPLCQARYRAMPEEQKRHVGHFQVSIMIRHS